MNDGQAIGANVAVKWRSAAGWVDDPEALQGGSPGDHITGDLDHVVDVALGVGPSRDGETDEVHRRRRLRSVGMPAEHHGADLASPDPAGAIELHGQRLTRELERRDVRQERPRIEIDRVAAEWLDARDAGLDERVAEVGGRTRAIPEIVLVHHLRETLGDCLEVTAREPPVRREALGEDQHVAALLGQGVVVHRQPAADVGQPVLLRRHGHAVRQPADLLDDVDDRAMLLPRLARLDEPRVLREPAGIEEQRFAAAIAHLADRPQVCEAHRLPAARVVRDRDDDDRDIVAALGEQALERACVEIALERVDQRRVSTLLDHQVHRLSAGELHVGSGRVEVGVVGDHLAGAADDRVQDLLGGTALVGGDDVAEREQSLDGLEEDIPGGAAGVALVPALDRGPLVAAHRPGTGVGQEVDQDIVGMDPEQVPAGLLERPLALGLRGQADGLDRMDPERLDDRLPVVHHREDTLWEEPPSPPVRHEDRGHSAIRQPRSCE